MNSSKISDRIKNSVDDNWRALGQLFPSVIKDGQLDMTALREELGIFEEVEREKYELTWAGKQKAKMIALEDAHNRTLNYIEEDSKYPETTENLYIEGDNLEALKLLQQNYFSSIKMIYIDPPYNTDGDFVYNDTFRMSKKESDIAEGVMEEDGTPLQENKKSTNRYHANWLNMMLPRLKLARQLLTDDGIILINIDEHEVMNLQRLCYEVFWEENELGTIIWDKRNPKGDAKGISYQHESILLFAKNKVAFLENCKMQRPKKNAQAILNKAKIIFGNVSESYSLAEANREFGKWIKSQSNFSGGEKAYNKIDENGKVYRAVSMAWPNKKKAPDDYFKPLIHPITKKVCPVPERGWRNPSATMQELLENHKILFGKDETTIPNSKYLLEDNMYENIPSILYHGGSDTALLQELGIPFDTPKSVAVCKEHIQSFTKSGDIILDFFSGSATIAHAVMDLNAEDGGKRKFIMIQFPENVTSEGNMEAVRFLDALGKPKTICELGKERIRRAGNKILEKNSDNIGKSLDIGFKVFRTADTNIKWNLVDLFAQLTVDNLSDDIDENDFVTGATDLDIVYEVMLRQKGVPLSACLECLDEIGERTYLYGESYLISLEKAVTDAYIEKIASMNSLPVKFIFRDSAFGENISLKEEIVHRLRALVQRNHGMNRTAYSVEFI